MKNKSSNNHSLSVYIVWFPIVRLEHIGRSGIYDVFDCRCAYRHHAALMVTGNLVMARSCETWFVQHPCVCTHGYWVLRPY